MNVTVMLPSLFTESSQHSAKFSSGTFELEPLTADRSTIGSSTTRGSSGFGLDAESPRLSLIESLIRSCIPAAALCELPVLTGRQLWPTGEQVEPWLGLAIRTSFGLFGSATHPLCTRSSSGLPLLVVPPGRLSRPQFPGPTLVPSVTVLPGPGQFAAPPGQLIPIGSR